MLLNVLGQNSGIWFLGRMLVTYMSGIFKKEKCWNSFKGIARSTTNVVYTLKTTFYIHHLMSHKQAEGIVGGLQNAFRVRN
jgi:hypothetical protein